MIKKSTLLFALASAAGFPYLLSSKSAPSQAEKPAAPAGGTWTHDAPRQVDAGAAPALATVDQPLDFQPLGAVLRFDITPAWVMAHWPRVTTGLGDIELHGYRVALVTGTSEADVAGALTYSFDAQQRLMKISLDGVTGDPRSLVTLVTAQFGLVRETAEPGADLYRLRTGRQVKSELKIRTAPIVRRGEARGRYEVNLVVTRPKS